MTTDRLIDYVLANIRREAVVKRAQAEWEARGCPPGLPPRSCPDCGLPLTPDHRFACEIDRHVPKEIP